MSLTDIKARTAKPESKAYKLADSEGLYLLVGVGGSKLWRWKYRLNGKENAFALGRYPEVGLADARKARDAARALVAQGVHPAQQRKADQAGRQAENANTVKAVAQEWIGKKCIVWSPYYLKQVQTVFTNDVYPTIGDLAMRKVTAAQLLAIVQRVDERGAPTVALLVRQWLSAVFRYAVATLRADHDPAAALKGAITRPRVQHRRPLTREQILQLVVVANEYGGSKATVIALKLLLLTFVRPGELRQAEWSEFDFQRAEWRIPAERMKMREMHIVPVADQVVKLLIQLKEISGSQRQLFPNHRRPTDCMTITTLNRALERMGLNGEGTMDVSAHAFRATASTILNEMGYRADVIERQLAHKDRNKVRASYNQAEYMVERKQLMKDWADIVEKITKNTLI